MHREHIMSIRGRNLTPSLTLLFVLLNLPGFAQDASAPQRGNRRPMSPAATSAPTAVGQVAAFKADESVTVEIRQRGGGTRQSQFNIDKQKTKIELPGEAKELVVGMQVSVWADKDDSKLAARIVAGPVSNPVPMPRRPNNAPNPNYPTPRASADPAAAAANRPTRSLPPREPVPGLNPAAIAALIDRHVDTRLASEALQPSPQCDDVEFVRRAYLDLTGVIPTAEEAAAFLENRAADKRARLVETLLASPRYGFHFADVWCERIVSRDVCVEKEPFVAWLMEGFNNNRGWDELVFQMLTAGGSFNIATRGRRMASSEPQALFMLVNTEGSNATPAKARPEWLAAESAKLFLGVQLQCAECHDHPFADWKQSDFWALAAFFGQVRVERQQPNGVAWAESALLADAPAKIAIPATSLKSVGTIVPARFLGDSNEYRAHEQQLLRHEAARWITSPENPYFAKAAVNRMWAHFFGRGLVNPVDDLRPGNPATHPEVLDLLADEFRRSRFDLKHLARCIVLSRAYQRSSQPQDARQDESLYSHRVVKVMGPGVFYDSLVAATGLGELKLGLPERKTKVATITTFTPREVFVDFFRSAQGDEASPLEYLHGVPQALKLLNAAQLNRVLPMAEQVARSQQSREQAIEQLYLAALARRPGDEERLLMLDYLKRHEGQSPELGYSGLLWILVNTSEFVAVK
jgi:hypothetical protein